MTLEAIKSLYRDRKIPPYLVVMEIFSAIILYVVGVWRSLICFEVRRSVQLSYEGDLQHVISV
jgi:hypothetical protein